MGSCTTKSPPKAIVSLSASSTETLYAIGAGGLVIAADQYSDYPSEVPRNKELSALAEDVVATADTICGYKPDVVILSHATKLKDELEKRGVAVWAEPPPSNMDDLYAQIVELGDATGTAAGAALLVSRMRSEINSVLSTPEIAERDPPLTYLHELVDDCADQHYVATSNTLIGKVYSSLGLTHLADEADSTGAAGGYPRVTTDYILKADPDIIFLSNANYLKAKRLSPEDCKTSRPKWSQLKAVKNGRVVEICGSTTSRWGPRIVRFFEIAGNIVIETRNAKNARGSCSLMCGR